MSTSARAALPLVLPDTSVWVDHFRNDLPILRKLLIAGSVRMHPFVATELALGSLSKRAQVLVDLRTLPSSPVAEQADVDQLLELHRLYSRGIGFVDLHLLASALLHGSLYIWTFDKRLGEAAERLGLRARI